ncbi:MAG: transketolase [Burkholderiales bacterium]
MKTFDRHALERGAHNIRKHIVNTIVNNGEGHGGSALSCADILSVLFLGIMGENDKFLLSGGHKCLALYGALVEKGIVDKSVLRTYNMLGSPVPGHPDASKLAGVEFSTGSLGHGLPLGCGYAMAAKMTGEAYKTYVLMGDGEQGEGSNWEAAAFASLKKLDNLIAIIDENGLQINGKTVDISKPTDFEDRYAAFGWSVRSVNGHDVGALYKAFAEAPFEEGKPSIIVAKTIKGKGISFMENVAKYHHWHPGEQEANEALRQMAEAEKRWQK